MGKIEKICLSYRKRKFWDDVTKETPKPIGLVKLCNMQKTLVQLRFWFFSGASLSGCGNWDPNPAQFFLFTDNSKGKYGANSECWSPNWGITACLIANANHVTSAYKLLGNRSEITICVMSYFRIIILRQILYTLKGSHLCLDVSH